MRQLTLTGVRNKQMVSEYSNVGLIHETFFVFRHLYLLLVYSTNWYISIRFDCRTEDISNSCEQIDLSSSKRTAPFDVCLETFWTTDRHSLLAEWGCHLWFQTYLLIEQTSPWNYADLERYLWLIPLQVLLLWNHLTPADSTQKLAQPTNQAAPLACSLGFYHAMVLWMLLLDVITRPFQHTAIRCMELANLEHCSKHRLLDPTKSLTMITSTKNEYEVTYTYWI